MRSTTYGNLVNGLAAMAGINPTGILAHEKALIAEYLSDATRFTYDYYPWPELLVTEKRFFREQWSDTATYVIGSEVYHDGKYYRAYNDLFLEFGFSPSEDETTWYEIGDNFTDDPWTESGIYRIGARVEYKGKIYICTATLAGETASGETFVNYEWDQITPDDTNYWKEIDASFDRYLPYEATGLNTIGTIISAHLEDPRYSDEQTLNWREGAEGIYIDGVDNLPQEIWVKYRVQAPQYDLTTLDETEISLTLAPAIKSHAYKSWLIGDGQHEKAELQDIRFMDMLVREIDKIQGQQDRAVPFQIQSEPYRRVNARTNYTVDKTIDKIKYVIKGVGESSVKFGITAEGRQAVVRKDAKSRINFGATSDGLNAVKSASPQMWTTLYSRARGLQVAKKGIYKSSFRIFTGGKNNIAIGYVAGETSKNGFTNIQIGFSASAVGNIDITREASSYFKISTAVIGKNALHQKSVEPVNLKLQVNRVSGRLSVVWASVDPITTWINPVTVVNATAENPNKTANASSSLQFITYIDGVVESPINDWATSTSDWDSANITWE